jgi:hypothetical protein
MASAVRQITSVGGDIRKIARLLQKKAPPGHMLAYINQEEADLLKERGGSGKPHADTGVPSFEDGEDLIPLDTVPETPYVPTPAGPDITETATPIEQPSYAPTATDVVTPDVYTPTYGTDVTAAPTFQTPRQLGSYPGGSSLPTPASLAQTPKDLDLLGRAAKATGLKEETLQKLGISGLQGLIGAYQANKAQQAGQAGKEDLSALAAPYRQQGQEMIGKAQRGELTPVGQQQLQAVQAQAAQGAERRGGVGAQQSMAQVEAFRQQLLQGQYDYGLKLSGIADNIITGAIKTGLQADQYVSKLTTDYFGNMARIMAGVPDKATTGA